MAIGRLFKALVPAVAAVLAGCGEGDGPAVSLTYDRGEIVDSLFFSATKKGPMLVSIHGNPFAIDDAALATVVHGEMAAAVRGRVVAFTTDEASAPEPGTSVKVVFGAPKNANGNKLCAGKLPDLTQDPDIVRVRALFCSDDELLADAEGYVRRIGGADDVRFKRLMFDLGHALFN